MVFRNDWIPLITSRAINRYGYATNRLLKYAFTSPNRYRAELGRHITNITRHIRQI